MSYLWSAGLAQDDRDNIEATGAVLDIMRCKEIAGGSSQSGFFGRCDGVLSFGEFFIRPGLDLDKNNTSFGIDHNQIYLAGFAAKISSEDFHAFAFEKFLAAFFTPSAEPLPVG